MPRTNWLHFIGAQYYATPEAFIVEAQKQGITRRIQLPLLRSMGWGDRIWLAQQVTLQSAIPGRPVPIGPEHPPASEQDNGARPAIRGGVVFGSFVITSISGLTSDALARLVARFPYAVTRTNTQPRTVLRGCGSYTMAAEYTVGGGVPLDQLAQFLIAEKARDKSFNPGKLMVGGAINLDVAETPFGPQYIALMDEPFSQGFRRVMDLPAVAANTSEVVNWDRGAGVVAQLPAIRGRVNLAAIVPAPLLEGDNTRVPIAVNDLAPDGAVALQAKHFRVDPSQLVFGCTLQEVSNYARA